MDQHWKDHLLSMDHMKEGINLGAYAQKDPLTEYKRESFNLFEEMRINIKRSVVENIYNVQLTQKKKLKRSNANIKQSSKLNLKITVACLRLKKTKKECNRVQRGGQKVGVTTYVHVAQERSSSTVTEPNKIQ